MRNLTAIRQAVEGEDEERLRPCSGPPPRSNGKRAEGPVTTNERKRECHEDPSENRPALRRDIQRGVLDQAGALLAQVKKPGCQVMIVSDSNVFPLYGQRGGRLPGGGRASG